MLVFSHLIAYAVLIVNSFYDIFNGRDVPDLPGLAGIAGGILFHGLYAWNISSLRPLYWCIGVGLAFSAYGWFAYWQGMWGGADAMTLSMLGFTAAGPISGAFNFSYLLDLLANFVIASVIVTVGYSVYKFREQGGEISDLRDALLEQEEKVSGAVLAAGGFGVILNSRGLNGTVFFILITALTFLYVFLKLVQDEFMVVEKKQEEIEEGDVAAPGEGFGKKIRGLTEEEVKEVSGSLEVRTGVPFIPVFLFTLALTDFTASGFWVLYFFY